jgi:hypothetical protein
MATRSTIGIIDNRTGVVTSIYCHWDGYPEHNGEILVKNWSDPDKIWALMDLGALSSLGEEIGEKHDFNDSGPIHCTAYGRDRGETQVGSQTHNSLGEFLDNGEEYNYLWDGVRWNCFAGKSIKNTVDLYNIKQNA